MFKAGKYKFPLGEKTYVMGILNYTPDSFSDGGLFNTPAKAAEHTELMISQGADIIDIGANSTRPGADILSCADELVRLKEVLPTVCAFDIPVSVDTFYPECAEYAVSAGASIINDIGGGFNPAMGELVKKYSCGYIMMHNPGGADAEPSYPDGVVTDVRNYLFEAVKTAVESGVDKSFLCVDPGFGFGKTESENLEMLRNGEWFKFSGIALLAALSRKRFIGSVTGEKNPACRDNATIAANTAAIGSGTDIIRVHNVPSGVVAARTADAIYRRKN